MGFLIGELILKNFYIFTLIITFNVITYGQQDGNFFPLERGNYWVYEGSYKQETEGGIEEKKISLRMEVLENISRGNIYASLIKGHPYDILNYDGSQIRGSYMILCISGKYFLAPEERSEAIYNRLKDSNDSLYNLLEGTELFLELPLEKGKVFGDADQISRLDGMYSWRVDSVAAGQNAKNKSYFLSYSSLPYAQRIEFASGTGIKNFRYKHNGFVFEVDLKLVEHNKAQLHGKNIN
jgi:hypothetical protein